MKRPKWTLKTEGSILILLNGTASTAGRRINCWVLSCCMISSSFSASSYQSALALNDSEGLAARLSQCGSKKLLRSVYWQTAQIVDVSICSSSIFSVRVHCAKSSALCVKLIIHDSSPIWELVNNFFRGCKWKIWGQTKQLQGWNTFFVIELACDMTIQFHHCCLVSDILGALPLRYTFMYSWNLSKHTWCCCLNMLPPVCCHKRIFSVHREYSADRIDVADSPPMLFKYNHLLKFALHGSSRPFWSCEWDAVEVGSTSAEKQICKNEVSRPMASER